MTFTARISNPIKGSVPATEIMLKNRLLTNDELTDFFNNTTKRLDVIEKADDTSNNLDVLTIVNDVNDCKTGVENLQDDVKLISDSLEELNNNLGEKTLSGTINSRLHEVWEVVYGTEGLIWMITEIGDDVVNIQQTDLVNINKELTTHQTNINNHKETLDEYDKRILKVENASAQIDVNKADIDVIRALAYSLQTQIEQIRSECNNTLASYEARIAALEQRTGLA